VVRIIAGETIGDGEVYLNLMENDLVLLIEKIPGTRLKVSKNVGVISGKETSLKRLSSMA